MRAFSKFRRLSHVMITLARASLGGLLLAAGLVGGPFRREPKSTGKRRVAFQAYAVHQAYFFELLIRRLLGDGQVDIYFLVWPHPHFPWSEQRQLREMAISQWGLHASRILPFWRTLWWQFDLMIFSDVLAIFPVRRTVTAILAHGAKTSLRSLRKGLLRHTVFDFDLAFPFGSYDRDVICSYQKGRPKPLRVHGAGSPQFDKYFDPGFERVEYLSKLGLNESRGVVLYAPHWSELNLSKGGEILEMIVHELSKLPVHLIVKPHAMSLKPGAALGRFWDRILRRIESAHVKVDSCEEDVYALRAADVLVTGISSRAFNFMLLDKPVVLFTEAKPPADQLYRDAYEMLGQGSVTCESLQALAAAVTEALRNPQARSDVRRKIASALFANPGRSTPEVARIIYEELGVRSVLTSLRTQASS